MPLPLLMLMGGFLIGMGIWGLLSGKVVAGSRGLRSHYYTRQEHPFLFYSFTSFYLVVGSVVLCRVL